MCRSGRYRCRQSQALRLVAPAVALGPHVVEHCPEVDEPLLGQGSSGIQFDQDRGTWCCVSLQRIARQRCRRSGQEAPVKLDRLDVPLPEIVLRAEIRPDLMARKSVDLLTPHAAAAVARV
jgi:hypothetical protein